MKLGIRKKLFLLMLSGSALSFLFLGLPVLYGIYELQTIVGQKEEAISREISYYTTEFAKEQAQEQMESEAEIHAGIMAYEAEEVQSDVLYLAGELKGILNSPEQYPSINLPNATYEAVPKGTAYVHFSPELAKEGLTPELEREIRAVSNLATSMVSLSLYYKCVFVGSRHGYTIRVDAGGEPGTLSHMSLPLWQNSYDARTRAWYQWGLKQQSAAFTGVYEGTDGKPIISCVMPYYDSEGLAGVLGVDCEPDNFLPIYQPGGLACFVLDRQGEVLLSHLPQELSGELPEGKDLRESHITSLAFAARRMVQGSVGYRKVRLLDEEYYLSYAPSPKLSWSVGTLVEKKKVTKAAGEARSRMLGQMDELRSSFRRLFASLLLAVLAVLLMVVVLVSYGSARASDFFCRPLRRLMAAAGEISRGNFSCKVNVQTGDELEQLAASFNGMTDELERYEKEIAVTARETSRLEAELAAAAHIQASLLPVPLPPREEFRMAAAMYPAKEVGGDFYDFFYMDEERLAVIIADVSDKGVSAALFMAAAKTVLKNSILSGAGGGTLAEAVALANDQLSAENDEGLFVTVFAGLLHLGTGEFEYVNGGHNPPLLLKGDSMSYLPLTKKSPVLGMMEGLPFEAKSICLGKGDRLFLYTDGVTEAMDEKGQMFTKERLEKKLHLLSAKAKPGEVIENVLLEVKRHAGEAEQSDDITMLALKYIGADA